MRLHMELTNEIERTFAARQKPPQVRLGDGILQLDSDVEQALWFSGRDWHELTWQDWQEHRSAIYFFAPDAFAYYLPSILILSAQNSNKPLAAAEALISELDRSPDTTGWTEGFASRFLELSSKELDTLKGWLLQLCEYGAYKGWGIAVSGPGDAFGRAYDTVGLIQKEVERRKIGSS